MDYKGQVYIAIVFSGKYIGMQYSKADVDLINIEGYKHYFNVREGRRGGGVSIFVKNNVSEDIDLQCECMESIIL